MYDLIILGGGPAGLTAAAYALHKRLTTLVVTPDLGGKTYYQFRAPWLEGFQSINGVEIVDRFKDQLAYLDFEHEMDRAVRVERTGRNLAVVTERGRRAEGRALIVATGASPQRLDVPGEPQLIGRGLSYSTPSHAPLFLDKRVALVGKGRRALNSAAELAQVARSLLLVLTDANEIGTPGVKKLAANPRVKLISGLQVTQVIGDEFVRAIELGHDGTTSEFAVDGLFVELGVTANTQMLGELVALDAERHVVVDGHMASSCPGLFAAGDVADTGSEQVLVAIGDGAKASLNAYEYLKD